MGWTEQGDGKLAYGVFIQNGRLKGDLKKALRRVIERYELPVRLTPNHNLILCDIEESWKADILHTLSNAGVRYAKLLLLLLPSVSGNAVLAYDGSIDTCIDALSAVITIQKPVTLACLCFGL